MKCTVCSHEQRREIDLALVREVPYRNIAEQHGVSLAALSRHAQSHIPQAVARKQREEKHARSDEVARDVSEELSRLQAEANGILAEARENGQLRTALAAVRELRALLDLQIRAGELEELEARISELEERAAS